VKKDKSIDLSMCVERGPLKYLKIEISIYVKKDLSTRVKRQIWGGYG